LAGRIAKILGISHPTVMNWLGGKEGCKNLQPETGNPVIITGADGKQYPAKTAYEYLEIRKGGVDLAGQNIIDWEYVSAEEVKDGEYFFLIVVGDSMAGNGRIYPGDKVLVRRQPLVKDEEIAVVLVKGEGFTLKRVRYLEDMIMLCPDNPKYEPQVYKPEEVQILGKVTAVHFRPKKSKL